MARKTFISYKYSDSRELRDKIIQELGSDSQYYRGESGYSDDLSSRSAEYIKSYLKDMIYNTSVTIVIVSPQMLQSRWIDWEIEYSLKNIPRDGRISKTNGIVCVVQKSGFFNSSDKGYNWIKNYDGYLDRSKLSSIILENRHNNIEGNYKTSSENYIDIVLEDEFLNNPNKHIEEAYNKSRSLEKYNIAKQIKKIGDGFNE